MIPVHIAAKKTTGSEKRSCLLLAWSSESEAGNESEELPSRLKIADLLTKRRAAKLAFRAMKKRRITMEKKVCKLTDKNAKQIVAVRNK